jgi:hypothetical protein
MIVMFTFTFPVTSAPEFGKAVVKNFQENPLPDFLKLIGPYSLLYEGGCKTIAIIEIEAGKESEAFKIFNRRASNYMKVPGFTSREEILRNMEESFSMLGLDKP